MGAHDYIIRVNASDREGVRTAWDNCVEEDTYESGSGAYAGNSTTFARGVRFQGHSFNSESEARDYILEYHNKRDSAIACSFFVPLSLTERQNKKIEDAKLVLRKTKEKKYHGMTTLCESFFNRKSTFVGCSTCSSRLNLDRLKAKYNFPIKSGALSSYISYPQLPKCPLCSSNLLSETAVKRVASWSEKESKAIAKVEDAGAQRPSRKIAWVVGGWAAC